MFALTGPKRANGTVWWLADVLRVVTLARQGTGAPGRERNILPLKPPPHTEQRRETCCPTRLACVARAESQRRSGSAAYSAAARPEANISPISGRVRRVEDGIGMVCAIARPEYIRVDSRLSGPLQLR